MKMVLVIVAGNIKKQSKFGKNERIIILIVFF